MVRPRGYLIIDLVIRPTGSAGSSGYFSEVASTRVRSDEVKPAEPTRGRLRPADWLAGFSLANLIFLRCWAELLGSEETRIYWLKSQPAPAHYVSLMVDVLLLGAFFRLLMGGIRRRSRIATRTMIGSGLLILLSLVNSLRTLIS